MSPSQSENTKRIAKNTLMLYIRMLFVMAVSLATSRIVLDSLGIDDYGIWNVVGGVMTMFSFLTSSLSTAISRFITFELGREVPQDLSKVFSVSLTVIGVLTLLVIVLAESVGVWFLNTHMNIPADRIVAANWVLQGFIFSFSVGLVVSPYCAVIIAHERMKIFAYIGMAETILKLFVAYSLYFSPFDRLKTYALLSLLVSAFILITYNTYCKKHFQECEYSFVYDKELLKSITGFAGWNFLGNGTYILNTQGVNILMNMFFGVGVNAARGIATQVDGVVQSFAGNFTMAMNPQIIKSYASDDLEYMHTLICRGAKYSYFLMFFFALPLILEARQVLTIWLGVVPEHAVIFLRLTLLSTLVVVVANTLVTAQLATGKLKKYQITVTSFCIWVLPLTYLLFKFGYPPEIAYVVYFIIYFILIFVRIFLLKGLVNLSCVKYINEVLVRMSMVSVCSCILPCLIYFNMHCSFIRLFLVCIVSVVSLLTFMYLLGLEKSERAFMMNKLNDLLSNINKR